MLSFSCWRGRGRCARSACHHGQSQGAQSSTTCLSARTADPQVVRPPQGGQHAVQEHGLEDRQTRLDCGGALMGSWQPRPHQQETAYASLAGAHQATQTTLVGVKTAVLTSSAHKVRASSLPWLRRQLPPLVTARCTTVASPPTKHPHTATTAAPAVAHQSVIFSSGSIS